MTYISTAERRRPDDLRKLTGMSIITDHLRSINVDSFALLRILNGNERVRNGRTRSGYGGNGVVARFMGCAEGIDTSS